VHTTVAAAAAAAAAPFQINSHNITRHPAIISSRHHELLAI